MDSDIITTIGTILTIISTAAGLVAGAFKPFGIARAEKNIDFAIRAIDSETDINRLDILNRMRIENQAYIVGRKFRTLHIPKIHLMFVYIVGAFMVTTAFMQITNRAALDVLVYSLAALFAVTLSFTMIRGVLYRIVAADFIAGRPIRTVSEYNKSVDSISLKPLYIAALTLSISSVLMLTILYQQLYLIIVDLLSQSDSEHIIILYFCVAAFIVTFILSYISSKEYALRVDSLIIDMNKSSKKEPDSN